MRPPPALLARRNVTIKILTAGICDWKVLENDGCGVAKRMVIINIHRYFIQRQASIYRNPATGRNN